MVNMDEIVCDLSSYNTHPIEDAFNKELQDMRANQSIVELMRGLNGGTASTSPFADSEVEMLLPVLDIF